MINRTMKYNLLELDFVLGLNLFKGSNFQSFCQKAELFIIDKLKLYILRAERFHEEKIIELILFPGDFGDK